MLATFRNATIGAAGCALAIGAAPAAWAGVMTYDTVAAFDAATTGLTSYAIPAPLPVGSTGQNVSPSITIGPVTFEILQFEISSTTVAMAPGKLISTLPSPWKH